MKYCSKQNLFHKNMYFLRLVINIPFKISMILPVSSNKQRLVGLVVPPGVDETVGGGDGQADVVGWIGRAKDSMDESNYCLKLPNQNNILAV